MGATDTLLLDRDCIAALMHPRDYLEAVERGMLAGHRGEAEAPPPLHLAVEGGGFHAKGAVLRGDRAVVAVKLNGNFPGNPERNGLPTIQGAVLLCDGQDGRLLAVLDSIEITLRRTAAASALAARHLARADSRLLAVIGCGGQATAQIEALRDVLPIERITLWDRDPARAAAVSARCSAMGIAGCRPAGSLAEACRDADAIVTCTTANQPFLEPDHVAPGAFVAAVGADSPAKSEITPALMARAAVVVDSLEQCLHMGDLSRAVAAGTVQASAIRGELGAILAGACPGRQSADEICLFDSTGTALQDVASALAVYERALASGAGLAIGLGG